MSCSGSARRRPVLVLKGAGLAGKGRGAKEKRHVGECGYLGAPHGVPRTLIPLYRRDTHIGVLTVLGLQRHALPGRQVVEWPHVIASALTYTPGK